MDALTNTSYLALQRYFHILSVLGYKSYDDVYKLITLLFIEELLTGELSNYIKDEDLKVMSSTINCLLGSTCLIDYKCNLTSDDIIHPTKYSTIIRFSEDNLVRSTLDSSIRITE